MARYIDADKLIEDYTDIFTEYGIELAEQFQGVINQSPTEDVEPVRHAKWERVDKNKVRCTNCEIIHLIAQYPLGNINWCPNCGAKMTNGE